MRRACVIGTIVFGLLKGGEAPERPVAAASGRSLVAQVSPAATVWLGAEAGSTPVRMKIEEARQPANVVVGTYVDKLHAWLPVRGQLLRTEDGGQTWQALAPQGTDALVFGLREDMPPGRLRFVDARRGFFSTATGIWKTVDGGDSWHRISRGSFDDMHSWDRAEAWMSVSIEVGDSLLTQSHVSSDGGATWHGCGPVARVQIGELLSDGRTGSDYKPERAYFLSRETGWAIATRTVNRQSRSAVLSTTDGGCTWRLLWENRINPDETLSDIYFTNDKNGWLAGGYSGSVLGTTDGGRSWIVLTDRESMPPVEAIRFEDVTRGWLIASANQEFPLLQTINGGRAWSPINLADIESLKLPGDWEAGQFVQMVATRRVPLQ